MGRKKQNRKAGKTKKAVLSGENIVAMLTITVIVSVLFIVLLVQGFSLKQQIISNDDKKNELTSEIESEKARTDSIESLKDYYQSDAFIREAAKDKLGLVEDGEIVFKAES